LFEAYVYSSAHVPADDEMRRIAAAGPFNIPRLDTASAACLLAIAAIEDALFLVDHDRILQSIGFD